MNPNIHPVGSSPSSPVRVHWPRSLIGVEANTMLKRWASSWGAWTVGRVTTLIAAEFGTTVIVMENTRFGAFDFAALGDSRGETGDSRRPVLSGSGAVRPQPCRGSRYTGAFCARSYPVVIGDNGLLEESVVVTVISNLAQLMLTCSVGRSPPVEML